jgi:hypothetical protein
LSSRAAINVSSEAPRGKPRGILACFDKNWGNFFKKIILAGSVDQMLSAKNVYSLTSALDKISM